VYIVDRYVVSKAKRGGYGLAPLEIPVKKF
jgi:hypothetical protein